MVKGFYNIFVNNNLLQLVNNRDLEFIHLENDRHIMIPFDKKPENLKRAIAFLDENKKDRVVLYSDDLEMLWEAFTKIFTPIAAAGGIVYNDKKEILVIYRRKTWDLPKGKIEPGEKKKEAAIREVQEECGLTNVEIINKLGNTYHTFGAKGKRKLKVSTWYTMYSNDIDVKPQAEEDIDRAEWMSLDTFLADAKPVFPNILDVVEAYSLKNFHY